jgi:hypothetical protein
MIRLEPALVVRQSFEVRYCCVLRRTERLIESGKYVRGLKKMYEAAETEIRTWHYEKPPYHLELRSQADSLLYLFGDDDTQRSIRDFYGNDGKKLVETHTSAEIQLVDIALIVQIFTRLKEIGYKVSPKALKQAIKPA